MRKEDELILACACFTIPAKQQKRIDQLLSSRLNWEYITQSSVHHNVANLVYRNIKNSSVNIDPDNSQFLHNIVLQNTARSLFQTGVLLKLLALFEEESIIVIPFKGPSLSQMLYDDPAIRSYCDLDILIRVDDVASASNILTKQGFIPEIELSKKALPAYMCTEDDITFHNQQANIVIELHWELSGQYLHYPLDFDCFQENIQIIEIAGRTLHSLSTEDLLFYLCIHGNKHMWSRLEWLFCVAELIKNYKNLDWEKVFNRADEFKCIRMVSLGLMLVSELLNTKLPDHIMERLHRDNELKPLYGTIQKILFPENPIKPEQENRFSKFHIQNRDSLQDRLHYSCRLLFQPTFQEWHTWPLPGYLSFLYYAFRPLRLGWEFWKRH